MIKIMNQFFKRKDTLEETWKDIKEFLHNNQVIVVDSNGVALSENQIIEKLTTETNFEFFTKNVFELEKETISEVIRYIDQVEVNVATVLESNDIESLIQSFADLMEALLEITSLCEYFQVDELNGEKVHSLLQKALPRVDQKDEQYMLDVIEYEIIPIMQSVREAFAKKEWIS